MSDEAPDLIDIAAAATLLGCGRTRATKILDAVAIAIPLGATGTRAHRLYPRRVVLRAARHRALLRAMRANAALDNARELRDECRVELAEEKLAAAWAAADAAGAALEALGERVHGARRSS